MAKAIRFNQLGGPEVLHVEDLPKRQPGLGEVLLKVEAVGLNRAESMYYHGFYMEKANLPSGLGYEAVGKVIAAGPEVDPALIGKRFGTIPGYSMNQFPVLAEEAVVPVGVLAAVPESFSAVEAAAVWMQYCTAYGALVPFGKVAAGDFVIITAASSSVGLAAIQIVKTQGGASIATTRTSAKKDQLIALGADHVIVTEEEDLVARVQSITAGKGARVVFDPVGGDYINALAQATANGGTIFFLWHALWQAHALPHGGIWPSHRHVRLHLRPTARHPGVGNHEEVHLRSSGGWDLQARDREDLPLRSNRRSLQIPGKQPADR